MAESEPMVNMGEGASEVGCSPMENYDHAAINDENVEVSSTRPMEDGNPPPHAMRARQDESGIDTVEHASAPKGAASGEDGLLGGGGK